MVYWYGSHTDENGKLIHDRKREQLDLYLYTEPKTKPEKQHNKEILQLVENIKAKRLVEAASGQHGFVTEAKNKASFYKFFEQVMATKKTKKSSSNYTIWECCLVQLKKYHPDKNLGFDQITPDWLEGAKKYFETQCKTKSGNLISNNTAYSYNNKLRAVINAAYAKGIINKNPLAQVTGIKAETTERTYLTTDEVKALVKTDCKYDVLKRAFLFSCLTGVALE